MQIPILIALGIFFLTSILLLILYTKVKDKYDEIQKEHIKLTDKFKALNDKLILFKDELSTKRIGCYQSTTTLKNGINDKKGDIYTYTIHVKELDRYTNGMSKIQLINLEITSGFRSDQYSWVTSCAKSNFSSLKKTSEIEWLESEETIKEMRKEKLKKLGDIENNL